MHILKTFDNYFSANILLQRMQNEGIHAYLKDEYTVTIDPILSNAIGGIKLMVNEKDMDRATDILQKLDDAYRMAAVCPQCGKNEIQSLSKPGVKNFVTALFTWLFSSYAVAPVSVYKCANCGYESKTLPMANEANN